MTSRPREHILILTPIGKDAANAAAVLQRSDIESHVCTDLRHLCELLSEDTSVLLIAEEALTQDITPHLLLKLYEQPTWSDIPIIVLTSDRGQADSGFRVMTLFAKSGNVTLLERPIRAATLISSVQVALRARRKQWENRDLMAQRQTLLDEARKAREEAENANRMKDQFLATLSHELRTPLNAILGWTQLLSNETLSPEESKLAIETIDRNARTQAQLIEDLLDVSRIISGKLRLDMQTIDLRESIRAAVDVVATGAASKGVQLDFHVPEEPVIITGDSARLQQVCWNLLSNAVKFTPKGGHVELQLIKKDRHAMITVCDNGIGIDADFLPYVFDRFRQADGSTTRRQGGLGLGLSIVKQLVELHGGTVSVHSDGNGTGAAFTIDLPIQLQEGTASNSIHKRRKLENDHTTLQGIHILVVDDERDSRDILQRALSKYQAQVDVASSVDEALHSIDTFKPDLILSDISMPERDGYDLIHELRQDGHAAEHIPAIAVTAFARPDDREKMLRSGFQAHVAKPVDVGVLTNTVYEVLQQNGKITSAKQ